MPDYKEWEERPPAKFTLEKLREQDKLNCLLKDKDNQFDKNIALMQKDISEISEKMSELNRKMDKFIETSDDRYASKLVEKVMYVLLILMITAVAGAVFKLIFIQ